MTNETPKLFIVTGASGTGKSTLVPLLKNTLPDNYAVYDWDEILRPYDGTQEIWAHEVTEKMFQLTIENNSKNISTVILGLVRPVWIKKYQQEFGITHISFCLLDITVEEREKRLKQRNAPIELIEDVEEVHNLHNWMKESGFDFIVIDTTNFNPQDVSTKIIDWIN